MTAEQLRNSILQEAISGRLVPQDPNDEPASVLLERIVTEQNKTLPPKKKKSVSLIAEPEDITPVSGWAYFYIKDLFDTTSGGTPIKGHPEYYDGDIPWVRSGELNSLYLYDSELRITEAGLKNSSAKYFPVDTVVIAMYGATIGKTSIFKRSMTTNQAICGIFPIDGILPEYIYYFLQNKKRDYCSIAFGSGQPNISQEKIKNTIFPLPPLAEQKRIVAKLEELLPIVEQYGKAQAELDELNAALPARLRQSILQQAIQGKLVPQDEKEGTAEELLKLIEAEKQQLIKEKKLKKQKPAAPITDDEKPFDIPASWEWRRIADICSITNGFTPRRTEPKFWTNGTINWFTVEDINKQGEIISYTEQKITKEATSDDRIVRAGSVLLCCTASVGRCAITTIPVTTNQQFNALTVKEEYRKTVSDTYLLKYAKTLEPTLHQLAGQTTFEFVSVSKVGNILIPLPPLAEQKRIVAKIEELFAEIDKLTK